MENVETQNPFATPKSLVNPQEENKVNRSNEFLWIGIVSVCSGAVAYALPYCFEEYSMASTIAQFFAMLLSAIGGIAGVIGISVGGIEAFAQLCSKTVFGQKETVFIGVALSFVGLLAIMFISR